MEVKISVLDFIRSHFSLYTEFMDNDHFEPASMFVGFCLSGFKGTSVEDEWDQLI